MPHFREPPETLTSDDPVEIRDILELIRINWKDYIPGENSKGVYGI
ncbi:MAG: hypothetical protein R2744_09900 [Bacteroidales bacterium]